MPPKKITKDSIIKDTISLGKNYNIGTPYTIAPKRYKKQELLDRFNNVEGTVNDIEKHRMGLEDPISIRNKLIKDAMFSQLNAIDNRAMDRKMIDTKRIRMENINELNRILQQRNENAVNKVLEERQLQQQIRQNEKNFRDTLRRNKETDIQNQRQEEYNKRYSERQSERQKRISYSEKRLNEQTNETDKYIMDINKKNVAIEKLRAQLFANSAVRMKMNANGVLVEDPLFTEETNASRINTRIGTGALGSLRRLKTSSWTTEQLRQYQYPLRNSIGVKVR